MIQSDPPPSRRNSSGLLFVLLLITACAGLMATHNLLPDTCLAVAPDNNRLAVTYEVIVHALLGITCRMAYIVGRNALAEGIDIVQMTTLWLSTAMFGCGLVLALVFILRALSLKVNGVDVGLGFTQLETIASVSFVLGFFNETPRRLLARVRDTIRTPPSGQ